MWRLVSAAARRGQPLGGVSRGPAAIRRWLPEVAEHHEVDLTKDVNAWYDALSVCTTVERVLRREGDPVLVIGGDHSLSAGSVLATRRVYPDAKVLWIDAHADVNTFLGSPSGNAHGMPLAALCGHNSDFVRFSSLFDVLDPADLTYIGLRDVDEGEAEWIDAQRRHGLTAHTMHDLRRDGVRATVDAVRDAVGDAPVHLSFDVDVLDPGLAPGTGTPVPGGMRRRELATVLSVLRTLNIKCLDLVEVNPDLDAEDERTARIAASIARDLRNPHRLGEVIW